MSTSRPTLSSFIGVDFGTSIVKASVVDEHGEVLAQEVLARGPRGRSPSVTAHDPDDVWWAEFVQIVDRLIGQPTIAAAEFQCIAVTGMVPNVGVFNTDWTPIHPALLFYDKRAYDIELWLDSQLGTPKWQNEVLSKLIWLRRHVTDGWGAPRYFATTHTYVSHRLTGAYYIDTVTAAECGSIYDPRRRNWNEHLLAEFDLHDLRLPPVVAPLEVVGRVTEDASRLTGLPAGLPVVAGTSDTISSAIGAGITSRNNLLVYYGTFNCAAILEADMSDVLDGHYAPYPLRWLTSIPRAGHQLEAMSELMTAGGEENGLARFVEGARQSMPGAGGVIFLQSVNRDATTVSSEPLGALFNLSLATSRQDVARAVLEAFGYWLRMDFDRAQLQAAGLKAFASGGGAKSALWRQLISEITRMEQSYCARGDRAFGSALLAMGAVDRLTFQTTLQRHASSSERTQPTTQTSDPYKERYEEYCRLVSRLGREA